MEKFSRTFVRCLYLCPLISLFCLCVLSKAEDDMTYSKIYYDVTSFKGCFRRFNGTHQIGCSTSRSGNVGVLHYVNDTASRDWLINSGPHKPYIVVITMRKFTSDNLELLLESNKLNGLIVLGGQLDDLAQYPVSFTPDYSCPNPTSDYDNCKHNYNVNGSGLMFRDLDMPWMVMLNQTEVIALLKHVSKNQPQSDGTAPDYPLAAAELKAFMHGAGNSEICLRRARFQKNLSPDSYCDKLGGQSSIAMLGVTPRGQTRADKSVIMIVARSDSLSLFENMMRGSNTPIVSVITLLATVEALKPYADTLHAAGKDVLFVLLTGESFDYIGSQALVYDMKLNEFPNITATINMRSVDILIELSDLLHAVTSKTLYTHIDSVTRSKHSQLVSFVNMMSENAATLPGSFNIENATASQPLPPSSSQMFARENTNEGFPAVVLADYDSELINKYYQSLFDISTSAGTAGFNETEVTETADTLSQISSLLATTVYSYITKDRTVTVKSSNATIQSLLFCLHVNPKCSLLYSVINPSNTKNLDSAPDVYPNYVGVYNAYKDDNLQAFMLRLLVHYSGDELVNADNSESCTNALNDSTKLNYNTYFMNGPEINGSRVNRCIVAAAQYINSTSPAFDIDGYDMSSKQYSTWTESVWSNNDPFHIKLFVVPSLNVKLISSLSGVAIFIVSVVTVFIINKKTDILFPQLDIVNANIQSTNL